MKMNKIILGLMIIGIISLSTAGIFKSMAVEAAPATQLDINELKVQDIKLDIPTSPAAITPEAALESAKKIYPGWAADATEVSTEYHLVTNNSFQGFSDEALNKNSKLNSDKHMLKTPAYIISFRGMSYESIVPYGFKGQKPVHHEYNVIVDATTGEALMGFSYR